MNHQKLTKEVLGGNNGVLSKLFRSSQPGFGIVANCTSQIEHIIVEGREHVLIGEIQKEEVGHAMEDVKQGL